MITFEKVKKYYEEGLWTKEQVAQAVVFKKITPEQYEEIVKEAYVEPPAQ